MTHNEDIAFTQFLRIDTFDLAVAISCFFATGVLGA